MRAAAVADIITIMMTAISTPTAADAAAVTIMTMATRTRLRRKAAMETAAAAAGTNGAIGNWNWAMRREIPRGYCAVPETNTAGSVRASQIRPLKYMRPL